MNSDEAGAAQEPAPLKRKRAQRPDVFEMEVYGFYTSLAVLVQGVGWSADAAVLQARAEPNAREIAQYARHHPRFRRAATSFLRGSDTTALITGQVITVLALAAVHGITVRSVWQGIRARRGGGQAAPDARTHGVATHSPTPSQATQAPEILTDDYGQPITDEPLPVFKATPIEQRGQPYIEPVDVTPPTDYPTTNYNGFDKSDAPDLASQLGLVAG